MKAVLKISLSDFLFVEILAVILAAVMISSVTAYVGADSIYRASIMGGTVTPILGVPGHLSGQITEKPPEYYTDQYINLKERISDLFGSLFWSNATLISSVYALGVLVALYPFLYRLRTSFVPLLSREHSGPVALSMKGLSLAFFILVPIFLSPVLPLFWVSKRWLSGISPASVILLAMMLIGLLMFLSAAIYSTYFLWGRIDLTVVFTLLLAFLTSGKLGFGWKTVWTFLGLVVLMVVFMVGAVERRWITV